MRLIPTPSFTITRILLIGIVLILLTQIVHAQQWNKLQTEATSLFNNKKYIDAIPVVNRAIEAAQSEFGNKHANYLQSLNLAAFIHSFANEKAKAEKLFSEVLGLSLELAGPTSAAYARALYNTGSFYKDNENYTKAEPFLLKAIDIRAVVPGKEHQDYISSLIQLAALYARTNRIELSSQTGQEASELSYRVLGEDHPTTLNAAYALATAYTQMQDYAKAEPVFTWIIDKLENNKKEETGIYLHVKQSLAMLYGEIGQREKAAALLVETVNRSKMLYGESSKQHVTSINMLASFFLRTGDFKKAEPLLLRSIEINKIMSGVEHMEYAKSLNNLAALYAKLEKYEEAIVLLEHADIILKKNVQEDHAAYTQHLINMAWTYQKKKQYAKSESVLFRVKDINKKKGENNFYYLESINLLGKLYVESGQQNKAKEHLQQALGLYRRYHGENNPGYQQLLGDLSFFYEQENDIRKAESMLLERNRLIMTNMIQTFTVLSEKEKENYLHRYASILESNNRFIYRHPKLSNEFYETNYAILSVLKSLSLADTRNMITSVRKSSNPEVKRIVNAWDSIRAILASEYSLPIVNRRKDMKMLEKNAEDLEKKLSFVSGKTGRDQESLNLSTKQLQSLLTQDEASVEYVRFSLGGKGANDSIVYAAYVLRKDQAPIFVQLCEEKRLVDYFSSTRGASSIKTLYRSEVTDEDEPSFLTGDSLYSLIWKPLLKSLNGARVVNYSPAGLLHKVAFHALPAGDSNLLMDKFQLHQYVNTRNSFTRTSNPGAAASIALLGDCQFTTNDKPVTPGNIKSPAQITVDVSRSSNKIGWQQLPGTLNEITSINSLFEKAGTASAVFSGPSASEEVFKSFSGRSPEIIHMATHGFFLPDPEKKKTEDHFIDTVNVFALAEDPLLRSGVILSGANAAWRGQHIEGREDGILTAYEIAQTDLGGTDIIVLSACETALGEIKGNEGVFGLQRAFKLAGVNKMVLSLWKVPDQETAELMQHFYSHYIKTRDARQSLNAARQQMRKKFSPYYWAAFVLIE